MKRSPGPSLTMLPAANYEARGQELPIAAQLAEQAALSGYMFKLGKNVRRWKRRFFVLQPSTTLFYYLSSGRSLLPLGDEASFP